MREDPAPGDTHRMRPLTPVDQDGRSHPRIHRVHRLGAQHDLVGAPCGVPLDDGHGHLTHDGLEVEGGDRQALHRHVAIRPDGDPVDVV